MPDTTPQQSTEWVAPLAESTNIDDLIDPDTGEIKAQSTVTP